MAICGTSRRRNDGSEHRTKGALGAPFSYRPAPSRTIVLLFNNCYDGGNNSFNSIWVSTVLHANVPVTSIRYTLMAKRKRTIRKSAVLQGGRSGRSGPGGPPGTSNDPDAYRNKKENGKQESLGDPGLFTAPTACSESFSRPVRGTRFLWDKKKRSAGAGGRPWY